MDTGEASRGFLLNPPLKSPGWKILAWKPNTGVFNWSRPQKKLEIIRNKRGRVIKNICPLQLLKQLSCREKIPMNVVRHRLCHSPVFPLGSRSSNHCDRSEQPVCEHKTLWQGICGMGKNVGSTIKIYLALHYYFLFIDTWLSKVSGFFYHSSFFRDVKTCMFC